MILIYVLYVYAMILEGLISTKIIFYDDEIEYVLDFLKIVTLVKL